MANSHIILQRTYVVISFTALFLMSSFNTTITASNGTKLVLRLIHRASILSPFYNQKTDKKSLPLDDDIRGTLIPDEESASFLVNVSIGEPPIPQLLIMDTGSPLTWICTNCNIPGLNNPTFNPQKSSTYNNVLCFSMNQCNSYYYGSNCGQESQCSYKITYEDDLSSTGILASEKFTFITSTGGIFEIPNLIFGIGIENVGDADSVTGILGLEPLNEHSLISRVSNKFSYCIGNISDPYYMYNQLILGEGAIIEGYSTPMKIKSGHYVVKLEGISIGEKNIEIDQEEFDFNVVIDSGTTITILQRSGFDPLKKEVMNLIDGFLQPIKVGDVGEGLCYKGNLIRDLKGFPVVTLHLAEGTDLVLDVEGMFRRVNDNIFCTALDVSDDDFNVIGVYAQQYYNVGFDLNVMKVTFQSIECELLED